MVRGDPVKEPTGPGASDVQFVFPGINWGVKQAPDDQEGAPGGTVGGGDGGGGSCGGRGGAKGAQRGENGCLGIDAMEVETVRLDTLGEAPLEEKSPDCPDLPALPRAPDTLGEKQADCRYIRPRPPHLPHLPPLIPPLGTLAAPRSSPCAPNNSPRSSPGWSLRGYSIISDEWRVARPFEVFFDLETTESLDHWVEGGPGGTDFSSPGDSSGGITPFPHKPSRTYIPMIGAVTRLRDGFKRYRAFVAEELSMDEEVRVWNEFWNDCVALASQEFGVDDIRDPERAVFWHWLAAESKFLYTNPHSMRSRHARRYRETYLEWYGQQQEQASGAGDMEALLPQQPCHAGPPEEGDDDPLIPPIPSIEIPPWPQRPPVMRFLGCPASRAGHHLRLP